jgi:hypothetical protein
MPRKKPPRFEEDFFKVTVLLTIIPRAVTEKSQMFKSPDGHDVWLPLSQIKIGETSSATIKSVEMPAWLAKKHGLEDHAE